MSDAAASEVERQTRILLHGIVDCEKREELAKRLAKSIAGGKPLRVKLGFDPTSTDLHLGHAVVLKKLRQFQDLGHHAVFIVGGATAMLGDPSGKDKTRPQLTREQVEANAKTYLEQAFKVVRRDEAHGAIEVRNNSDWFLDKGFADFVRLCSKMTVARMIERDSFAKRIKAGTPVSIHEFIYPLLQGQDSVEVRADVELGGTDQLFNLLVGRDLQSDAGQAPQVCITTSLGNFVGLTFSADEMFGKVMSLPDATMPTYFELLTERFAGEKGPETLAAMIANDPRQAKAGLAEEITASFHSKEAAAAARQRFDRVFREKDIEGEAQEVQIPAAEVPTGKLWIADLLLRLGFVATSSEAKHLIAGRGVKVDGEAVVDWKAEVDLTRGALVRAGKRRFARVVLGR
jgi:tyrosyl-tRNA synthetase